MAIEILNRDTSPGLCGIGTKFSETVKGWPGSGFERQTTEVTVDRLDYEGHDELRLNVMVRTMTAKRTREAHGSISLPGKFVEAFMKAATTKRNLPPECKP